MSLPVPQREAGAGLAAGERAPDSTIAFALENCHGSTAAGTRLRPVLLNTRSLGGGCSDCTVCTGSEHQSASHDSFLHSESLFVQNP